ncbi:pentapeptide repeat-containing protein [Microbispora hainanensis]|uniref:pentapeptide repeat-containing protein n=1 Tax=Microbispora hainanensis TaxID=568844 RepID=UPI003AF3502A
MGVGQVGPVGAADHGRSGARPVAGTTRLPRVLPGTVLPGTVLPGAVLSCAVLSGAVLARAILSGAVLARAVLPGVRRAGVARPVRAAAARAAAVGAGAARAAAPAGARTARPGTRAPRAGRAITGRAVTGGAAVPRVGGRDGRPRPAHVDARRPGEVDARRLDGGQLEGQPLGEGVVRLLDVLVELAEVSARGLVRVGGRAARGAAPGALVAGVRGGGEVGLRVLHHGRVPGHGGSAGRHGVTQRARRGVQRAERRLHLDRGRAAPHLGELLGRPAERGLDAALGRAVPADRPAHEVGGVEERLAGPAHVVRLGGVELLLDLFPGQIALVETVEGLVDLDQLPAGVGSHRGLSPCPLAHALLLSWPFW